MSIQDEMMKAVQSRRPITVEDMIDESRRKIVDAINDSTIVRDAYGNSLEAIGTDDKVKTFTNYGISNDTLNWALWLALYNDSWVFKRAIDKPANDEIRCGITIQGNGDYEAVYRRLKKHRFDLIQLLQWGALFGGSIACLMFDNMLDEDYEKPMDYNKIKKAKTCRMYVVDRWYGVSPSTSTVSNMNSLDFGKPKYYDVTLANGHTVKFHHDYVLRYEHRTAPQLVKCGMLQGWGYAEGSHIVNELLRDDQLKASIQSLIDKSLIEVIKMSGMRGVFMGADQDNENQLRKRLEMVNWGRTFNSLTFLDKDDDYQQNQFSGLSGLADILEKNMWLISSALEMQGILFGDLKGGFSQDELALERYDETINGRCESYVRPVMEKLLSIFYKLEGIDEKVEFTFNSLLDKQQDKETIESLKNFTELANQLLEAGIIDTQQFARALQKYTQDHTVDFGLTEDVIAGMSDKMEEELEGLDLNEEK